MTRQKFLATAVWSILYGDIRRKIFDWTTVRRNFERQIGFAKGHTNTGYFGSKNLGPEHVGMWRTKAEFVLVTKLLFIGLKKPWRAIQTPSISGILFKDFFQGFYSRGKVFSHHPEFFLTESSFSKIQYQCVKIAVRFMTSLSTVS